MALQTRLTALFDAAFQGADFPEGFRVAAAVRGFAMGESRQPATAGQRESRAKLAATLRAALAASGLTPAQTTCRG
jgi:dihydrodipicolinate synthase/N-acetylneuraminate lyase